MSDDPKMGFPFGAGRFSNESASIVLDVVQRPRLRPLSLSRSKIISAKAPIIHAKVSRTFV